MDEADARSMPDEIDMPDGGQDSCVEAAGALLYLEGGWWRSLGTLAKHAHDAARSNTI
jgi:hypothetical protein